MERLLEILEMISSKLVFTEDDLDRLDQLPVSDWFFVLKSKFWESQLALEDGVQAKEAVYLLLEIENKKGKNFCLDLLESCRGKHASGW